MTFFTSLITFVNDILTFYLPIFYTFRYLATQDPQKVSKILKFWCVLSMSYVLQYVYSLVLAENLDIILDLVIHAGLIYDDFNYSQLIYDSLLRPFYKNNQDTINNFSKHLEKYFEEKTQQVQSKVSESATDKIRGFVGDILVGTLNPANKKKEQKEQDRGDEEDAYEKDD